MSNAREKATKVVLDELQTGQLVNESDGTEYDLGTTVVGEDGVEKVLVAKEWLEEIQVRLAQAERPVLVKARNLVVNNRRKLVLAGATVATLGVAAYAATHKDLFLEAVEETSEKAELGAQAVKKDARKARTGSTTK